MYKSLVKDLTIKLRDVTAILFFFKHIILNYAIRKPSFK